MTGQKYSTRKNIQNTNLFTRSPLLSHLDIELTERCNNACVHCYINLPASDNNSIQKELTTDQWKDVLRQAAELGALTVRLTGGEPLLRKDFADLYLFIRKLGIKVTLFTNARLITPTIAKLFSEIPPLKPIEVSVYGMKEDTYDCIARKPGAFQQFRNGIAQLKKYNIPFTLKSVTLPTNIQEIDEFESWAIEISGKEFSPPYIALLSLRSRRDSLRKNKMIKSLRFSPEENLWLLSRREADYRKSVAVFSEDFLFPQGDNLFTCGAGNSGCVDAYGKYQICMLLRHPDTVFDLANGNLRSALSEFFPKVRIMKAKNPVYLKRCANCFLKGLCEQCPARSWAENGTLDTPVDYLCQIAHSQACYLGLVEQGEHGWEVIDWQDRIRDFYRKTFA